MIKQTTIGLNSRSEANPYNEDGFLPLITAPMYSVVNHNNHQTFLDNKIQVCLPRSEWDFRKEGEWCAVSLEEFNTIVDWKSKNMYPIDSVDKICIDTANGNMPELHEAIRKAKEIHGDNLIIMAGNVASVEAFLELAKTGVDYIRVGIGGGGGCNTTSNTGVGQDNLEKLIYSCKFYQEYHPTMGSYISASNDEVENIKKVKIVADGISSYIKQCEVEYGFNDNGYAAINKLLFAGANLVMIGKLFAQCLESAGEKTKLSSYGINTYKPNDFILENKQLVKYSGMSTQEEQKKYKSEFYWKWWWGNSVMGSIKDETIFYDFEEMKTHSSKHSFQNKLLNDNYYSNYIKRKFVKPSEGSVQWIPVRWTLSEWLYGSNKQDSPPYLMGWVNSIKSAMSYTGKTKL